MQEDEEVRSGGSHRSSLSLDPAGVQFINNHRTYVMQNVCLAIGLNALHTYAEEDAGL